jgi:hypothetical protein
MFNPWSSWFNVQDFIKDTLIADYVSPLLAYFWYAEAATWTLETDNR